MDAAQWVSRAADAEARRLREALGCGRQQGQAYKEGHVRARAVSDRTNPSWLTPREGENLAGALRRFRLVGKQTTSSQLHFLPNGFLGFVLLHHISRMCCPTRCIAYLVHLGHANRTGSAAITQGDPTIRREPDFTHKLFGLQELPSGVRTRVLTGARSERYGSSQRGKLGPEGSTEMAKGCVRPPTLRKPIKRGWFFDHF